MEGLIQKIRALTHVRSVSESFLEGGRGEKKEERKTGQVSSPRVDRTYPYPSPPKKLRWEYSYGKLPTWRARRIDEDSAEQRRDIERDRQEFIQASVSELSRVSRQADRNLFL